MFYVSARGDTTGVYSVDVSLPGKSKNPTHEKADSIMQQVIANAKHYENTLSKYEAEVYVKGRAEILKQNHLIRFAHHLFPVNRKTKDMVFEMTSNSKFESPNIYHHDLKAVNGNAIPNYKKQQEFMQFLNLNIYAPTAYNEGFLLPLAKNAFRFYQFELVNTVESDGFKIFHIHFKPKRWNVKLLSGDLYIIDKLWTIDQLDIQGIYSFAEFRLGMSFSRDYRRFILPEEADLFIRYQVLGNTVETSYHAGFKYSAIEWVEESADPPRRKSLDLSSYYSLSSDTVPIITDSLYWEKRRDIPLTEEEEQLYAASNLWGQKDPDSTAELRFLKVTEKITNSIRLDSRDMRFRYSGFINPFRMGYSKSNGFTYKQKIRFSKTFRNGKELRFNPEAGFVFKRKECYFRVGGDWEYLPERIGYISLNAGNDNNSYSSEIMQDINEMLKDSVFTFEDLNLQYFRHYYVELRNNIELFHGFQVSVGASYHRRLAVKDKNRIDDEDITDKINDRYNDFTPLVRLSYTPRQYYRMDGRRKEYVYSRYPTTSIEIARGIPGVLGSTGNYTRIEGDIHQSIPIGLLRRFNYHLSAGMFTMQHSTYFADFEYFRRRYFPQTWDDQLGGVFNQLGGEWYNAADKYIQAHFMYQSPFVLLQLLNSKTASRYILSERFYLSTLSTPVLKSYSEIGYGIGNHIFNVAVFAGFNKLEYQSIGFKFAYEL
ncbi:MAG: DUF5686 family protein [Tannerellaceae bacterium]|nr:DUF5686 family protein [Tannerellaceae bacterium]